MASSAYRDSTMMTCGMRMRCELASNGFCNSSVAHVVSISALERATVQHHNIAREHSGTATHVDRLLYTRACS